MNRLAVVAVIVGLVVGVLVGYLWWGVGTQRQLNAFQGQLFAGQSDLKAAQGKIKSLEAELRMERDRRQRLEEIVAKGRK